MVTEERTSSQKLWWCYVKLTKPSLSFVPQAQVGLYRKVSLLFWADMLVTMKGRRWGWMPKTESRADAAGLFIMDNYKGMG